LQHAKGLPFEYLLGEKSGDESKIKELLFKEELRIDCFEMVGELRERIKRSAKSPASSTEELFLTAALDRMGKL